MSAATVLACTAFMPVGDSLPVFTAITAEAAEGIAAPAVKKKYAYSNKIELTISNLSKFSSGTSFEVYAGGKYVKKYSLSALKKKNLIEIFHDGDKYLKSSTNYSIRIRAVNKDASCESSALKIKTEDKTYYQIKKNAQLYTFKNGVFTKSSKVKKLVMPSCVLCSSKGRRIAGLSIKSCDDDYLLINEGEYKGKYVKVGSLVSRTPQRNARIKKVVDYAASMDGGRYVYGGASYKATDCSGLTMQAYDQIGVSISHSVRTQAKKGKSVSMKNIQAGDLIICNNYGHVAMYIGDGKIVHAMSSYYGIRIQPLNRISYCGKINTIRRII